MTNHRRLLIEDWLPIAELSEESMRERRSMTALPPIYYLHVWWARRPLVASRAAVLGSLLPNDFDRSKFQHLLGIHGNPMEAKIRIEEAKKTGENLGTNPYGYSRAFQYSLKPSELDLIHSLYRIKPKVLDPTAGGGSIPFESIRLGLDVYSNDLNPVAWLSQKATIEFPSFGKQLIIRYNEIVNKFKRRAETRFAGVFPLEEPYTRVDGYLYTHTVSCPSCGAIVPLSPNWKLSKSGHGVQLIPQMNGNHRIVGFKIVTKAKEISAGTVKGGAGLCPFSDCSATISGDDIKAQAQNGKMGDVLYAIVLKRRVVYPGKIGKNGKQGKDRVAWERDFRTPQKEDDVTELLEKAWKAKLPAWELANIIPDEDLPEGQKTNEPIRYGMKHWKDLFSSRQLFGHCTSVEVFQELVREYELEGKLDEVTKAAFAYIAIALDKMLNYNSRMSIWMSTREVVANTFNRHDFAFAWSFSEMAPTITGAGYDWAFEQVGKCVKELIGLVHGEEGLGFREEALGFGSIENPQSKIGNPQAAFHLTLGSADSLSIPDNSIDAVVMDPPYYDNVMYAELSDFFYVWLKRTAGLLYPEAFQDYLTDKDREAVANPARFKGTKKAKETAGLDYQRRMARIFQECKRVLKPDGVMTVMFTHKASGAWDALSKSLVEAGFTITASWPINTEAEGSLHIKDKTAAKSTIFLVCRNFSKDHSEINFWEEVEPLVKQNVLSKIEDFQKAGIQGVDLYLASFGPALEIFSAKWPLQRSTSRTMPKDYNNGLFGEWNPFAVFPEDALDSARTVVK